MIRFSRLPAAALLGLILTTAACSSGAEGPDGGASGSATSDPAELGPVAPGAASDPAASDPAASDPAVADPAAPGAPAPDAPAAVLTPGPPPPPGATGPPAVGITSLAPVPVGAPAAFGGGLVAKVATIDPVDVTARGPGEIAGPGVAVTVELSNESAAPIDVGGVVVNAYYGAAATPANANDSAPAAPATGTLPAGQTSKGVYVFQVPRAEASLTVEINYSGSPNVVLIRR